MRKMAAEPVPKTMRALVAPRYCRPDGYEIMEVPVPKIKAPDEVLIRIHAAGIFFGDAQHAAGSSKMLFSTSSVSTSTLRFLPVGSLTLQPSFPIILGRSGSGTVAAVGSGVTSLRAGDAVYGVGLKRPMARYFSDGSRGWAAEYAVTTADLLLPKPAHVSFEAAAMLLANTVTAIQITRAAVALGPVAFSLGGSLEGKTVLVTAGLGASTSVAAQYAKNVMGAREVITTVSSAKVPLVDRYLGPGTVDRVIDYQTQDVVQAVGRGKVDLLYCSRPDVWSYLPVMKREGGVIAAIVAVPSSEVLSQALGEEVLPFWLRWGLDLFQWWYRWKLWGTGVQMKLVSGNLGVREDLEVAGEIIATGKVKGVYTAVPLEDLDAIKKGCEEARTLKGRIGKLVVKMV